MKQTLSALSGIIFLIGYVPYISAVLRKQAQPCKASWIIWALLDLLMLGGMYLKHALNGQILGATFGSLIVMVLACKHGKLGMTRLDKACLAVALASLPLGLLDPTYIIVVNSIVVFIGAVPTFISTWEDFRRENRLAWAIYAFSCIPAVLAIPRWTWADAVQPVSYAVGEVIMMYLLFVRPWLKATAAAPSQA